MPSRYNKSLGPQPTRIIKVSTSDKFIKFKNTDTVDNLADFYYGDPTLGWIIMCANPDFGFEFQIPAGAIIRIPLPLTQVFSQWGENSEI